MVAPTGGGDKDEPPDDSRSMATFRRDLTPGATWFFTVVTGGRRPWLTRSNALSALRDAMAQVRSTHPFRTIAAVVLPDHLHVVWELPGSDAHYGRRWGLIKREVSGRLSRAPSPGLRRSQRERHESGLWQRRFWEHRIRDQDDLQRHVDYIHYNPVKHGLVTRAIDWPHSTMHAFVRRGWMTADWAAEPGSASRRFGE